jgi:hypothetical protein
MADYYPLIARAVSNLGNNTGEARQALYERARTALVEQMRGRDPPASESEIMVEQRALAAAIHSVEDIAARLPRGGAKAVDRSPPNPNPIAERRPTPEPKKYKAANRVKTVGMTALGVACFAGTLLLSAGYVFGLAWVSIHVFEYLILAVPVAIVLCLFILLPLALFRKTRSVSVYGFFIFLLRYLKMRKAVSCILGSFRKTLSAAKRLHWRSPVS